MRRIFARARRARRWACEPLEARKLLSVGDLDNSFDDDGRAEVNLGNGMTFDAADVAVQADGKTVIVGSTSGGYYGDREGDRIVVARLLIDGDPDPSFGPSGTGVVMTAIDADAHGYGVAIQGDGKIVVVGTALETSGVNNYQHAVVRYDTSGALAPTFGGDGILHFNVGDDIIDNGAFDVALQSDGKIVVVGEFQDFETPPQTGDDELSIIRLNPDGTRDINFGFVGFVESDFGAPNAPVVAIDYNGTTATNPYFGSIVVAGTDGFNDAKAVVLRLNPNGSFVDAFDGDGQASFAYPGRSVTRALGVLPQADGKIVLAGYTAGLNGANDFLLLRYNADGTLDPTFGGQGTGYVLTDFSGREDRASSIIRNFNGDRLLVGGSSNGNFAVARYTNNGILDTTFQSGGKVITPYTSGPFPQLAPGFGRRFTAAGGANFHAVRYLDAGANLVAIGSLDLNGGSEVGPENANFFVGRTEPLPTTLRVYLNIGGTANAPFFTSGEDYRPNGFSISAFGSYVDIPPGQTVVSLSITPVDDAGVEGDETAIIAIAPDPSYDIGTPASVTLDIHDGDASTIYAAADAHVRDGDAAATNFGAANVLETQLGGSGENAETYVKFNVAGVIPDVTGVRLRLYGRLTAGSSPVTTAVFGVSASGWGEGAITWDNRPPPTTDALATVSVGSTFETAYDFDVTNFVRREKAAGRDVVTLLLRNTTAGAAQTVWASRSSAYSDPRLIVTSFNLLPPSVPRVTQVFAASTAWTAVFRQSLEDHGLGDSEWGYAVPDGAAQLADLPWANVNQFSVRFNTGVDASLEHLAVRGLRVPGYVVTSFGYDEVNFVATWTILPGAAQAATAGAAGDRVLLDLDGDSPGGVTGGFRGPRYLDGEWANGADAYNSGNGAEGGDFRFQLNVLPGDVDRDGRVTANDLYTVRARLLRAAADPFSQQGVSYSPLSDLDGDGVVGVRDYVTVRTWLSSRLPAGTPAIAASPFASVLIRAIGVMERLRQANVLT